MENRLFKKEINKTQERYYEYVAPDKHCLQAYSPTESYILLTAIYCIQQNFMWQLSKWGYVK